MMQAFFDDSVPGKLRLSRVFWIEGVLASNVLFLALLAIYQYGPAAALVAGVVCFLVYTAWIMRKIWLNAPNVDRPELASMARVLTIGWTINSVTVCVFLMLAKLGHQPLQILH
ncbi:hypothetical protein [Thermomonas sp. HDW16]|uniref:hypothetical protein n=1 Tax=Thermomonas sp. HDW16 TaxID=2714945 RepID=UPI001409DB3C|nr:hypothetical protein [Thermomonas sp. HDW16]QIL20328.1 hypothetical protein G7079_05985 [Thermomonas sp. HDW16]